MTRPAPRPPTLRLALRLPPRLLLLPLLLLPLLLLIPGPASGDPAGRAPVAGAAPERPALGEDGRGAAPGEAGEGEAPARPVPGAGTVALPGLAAGGGAEEPAVAPDHVIVRFAPDLAGWQRRQLAQAAGGAGYKTARSGRFAEIAVAAGDSVPALLGRLQDQPGVLSAEADPIARGQLGRVEAKTTFAVDPLEPLQWTFDRIRLPEARSLNSPQGEGVIVAVLDSGVAFGDGAAFPARRGLDLEGTRFLPGLDLVDGGPPYDEGLPTGGTGGALFGHGTFAAAQIAATAGNGVAGTSVAPRALILPVRVLDTQNRGLFSDIAEGIDFAVSQGAKVINMSLGGNQGTTFLAEAVARARASGVLLVAAAGNEAEEPDFAGDVLFPARYPEVVAVGATAFSDRRASYSSFGAGLEVMAPAGESTARFAAPGVRDAALAPSFLHDPVTGETLYASFWANGTSFAAPQVAGVAALLISLGVEDPEAVRLLLILAARDLGAPGRDDDSGAGLIDALEAHRGLGFAF